MVRMMMMRGEVEFFCIASMKVRMKTTMNDIDNGNLDVDDKN